MTNGYTQSRDNDKYEETPECIKEYCGHILQYFSDFLLNKVDRLDEVTSQATEMYSYEINLEPLAKILIDHQRLQRAVMSAFIDIRRYAEYHNLYDEGVDGQPPKINICHHKEAGFLVKWFMNFSPVLVPNEASEAVEKIYIQCRDLLTDNEPEEVERLEQAKKIEKITYELFNEIININEQFILEFALHFVIEIPRHEFFFLCPVERRDLIYLLTYRCGRLNGCDLSMTFHWIKQALAGRPSKANALLQGLKKIPGKEPGIQCKIKQLEDLIKEAKKWMPTDRDSK